LFIFYQAALKKRIKDEDADIEVVISFTFGWLNESKKEKIELYAITFRHIKIILLQLTQL
jgi:hypothetical protein